MILACLKITTVLYDNQLQKQHSVLGEESYVFMGSLNKDLFFASYKIWENTELYDFFC